MDGIGELARFAANTLPEDLPDATISRTALILADCIGAIVSGAAESENIALLERQSGTGPALVIGTSRQLQPGIAALLNGTAGTTLETDEGSRFCKGHPGMHTVPAALAVTSTREVTGRALLSAIAIGYEVGGRVAIATRLRPAMHTHGNWGTICAAVAVARLQEARPAAMRHAINIAANLGLATSRRTMLEGGSVRNAFAGVSGQMGVLAGDLLAAGFTGDRDGVGEVFGRVVSDSFDTSALTAGLGDRWEVTRNYFRLHSCCRYNHAALDGLDMIRADAPDLDLDAIESIEVETYSLAAELNDPEPQNSLASKFSIPFALATSLWNSHAGVESFTTKNVLNPNIRALASKVRIVEVPALTAQLPDKRPARVTLRFSNGRTLSAAVETNRGDQEDPYSSDELFEKYCSLTRRLWRADAAEMIWEEVMALDQAVTAARLLTQMKTAVR